MRVLAVNAGSTSMKVSLVDGSERVRIYPALDAALDGDEQFDALVHRVVHGGERSTSAIIDDRLVDELEDLVELAPLHQPAALEVIRRCRRARPDIAQVACFDTAFHATIPVAARTYALPARLRDKVRVYGFHGLSHAWAAARVAELAPGARRIVVAHLGGGQSLCGVLNGRSVTTTMGFTPVDGLVMATRCGSLDPGAVVWLARHTDEDLAAVLEHESGLRGLCGASDMREVIRRCDAADDAARLALDVYLHRLVAHLGGCVATLGGLDALVFTGGIGEHSRRIRELVASSVAWMGLSIDPESAGEEITRAGAKVRTFVIEAGEDLEMARHAAHVLDR